MGAAHAVGTAAAHDNDTILTRTGFRRGNGLGALVQVLVQRVATVAGDHDIAGNAGALAPFADKATPSAWAFSRSPAQAAMIFSGRSSATLKMNWTLTILQRPAYPHGWGCAPARRCWHTAGNGLVAVVFVDGLLGADARQDALAAAGEAGEEVGLNEALGHQQVGLGGHLVDDQLGAGGKHADLHVARGVPAVVADELFLVGDLLAHLVHQLLVGGGAVEAGGDEEGDVDVGIAFAARRA